MLPTSEKSIEGLRCTACQNKIQLVEEGKMVEVPNETKANKYMKGRKDMNDNNQTEERNYQIRKSYEIRKVIDSLEEDVIKSVN